jgi:hypothetical protein
MEGHRMTRPIAALLRWVALIGTLGGIATLEFLAGQAAGWSDLRSAGVPLGIDAFVMSVLLADRARWYDRAAALGLMEFTVVVSAVAGHHDKVNGQDANVTLGAVLATALVFALWRVDETFRAERHHADALAAATAALAETQAHVHDLTTKVTAMSANEPISDIPPVVVAVNEKTTAPPARRATHRMRPATDDELAAVIADVLAEKPGAGRPTIVKALKDAGYSPGNGKRLTDAIAAHKRGGLHAVPTTAAL